MKSLLIYLNIISLIIFGIVLISSAGSPKDMIIEINPSKSHVTIGDSLSIFCKVSVPDGIKASEPYLEDKSSFVDIQKQWGKKNTGKGFTIEHYSFLVYWHPLT